MRPAREDRGSLSTDPGSTEGERTRPSQAYLAVGRVARAHGVRGEVAVLNLSEVAERYAPGAAVRLEDGRSLTVERSRPHGHRLLVKFEEVPDRTAAEALRGEVLLVPAEESPDPPDGAYWVHQLVGVDVVTEAGRGLGRISDVLHNPANDIWVVDAPEGEILVPAVAEMVADVDLAGRRVTVREMEGLVP